MDKKILIIGILTAALLILTNIRETNVISSGIEIPSFDSKDPINTERIQVMADSTLIQSGITIKNIRHSKKSNDARVYYAEGFDVIGFLRTMNDSLDHFNARTACIENPKDKSSLVQFIADDKIIASYTFAKEPEQLQKKNSAQTVTKKGVSPLAKKQINRR